MTDIQELSDLHKVSIKHQITACILLEKLVNHTVDGAEAIIQKAQIAAKDPLLKLCSKENKIIPTIPSSVI